MAESTGITFADDVQIPVTRTPSNNPVKPILPRSVSKASSGRFSLHDGDLGDVDEGPQLDERDFKHRQTFTGWLLFWLAYQSTGVIYGDIGTSPLYVFSSTFSDNPSYDDLVGATSIIIWSLTLIVSIKYVFIVLCADDEGEGGTFAMYSLLSRYSNIMKRDPKTSIGVKMERFNTGDLKPANMGVRTFIEHSKFATVGLKILAVFGVSLIMADGVLTPAQSVLGAIQGLEVVAPDISNGTVIGVSCAILVLLFFLQPFGISRLGSTFAPIVIIWLLFNFSFGIYNLVMHDYTVLKAFSPYFAGLYFVRNGTDGWRSLGGILLCFTGCEALFADLGAFSKRAIQISWLGFVFPCLLLAYLGQAAYISTNPSAYSNPFFNSVPNGAFWPSLIIAVLAAVVASQAVITATFQLLTQVINTSYFPRIKQIYTSTNFHGQVYIPFANWLLMIGTVVVTAVYSNTTRLGNAYGVCVILVTFITTCMVCLVAIVVWRIHPLVVFIIWLPFITLDGLYLSSALTKVPDGAWFTLLLAVILASVFILWRFGKDQQWAAEARDRLPIARLVIRDHATGTERLHNAFGGGELTRIKGLGIFFDKAGHAVPTVYAQFLQKFEARPAVHVFLQMRALSLPTVAEADKYSVAPVPGIRDCYRVTLRHGYNDEPVTQELGSVVYTSVRRFIVQSATGFAPPPIIPADAATIHIRPDPDSSSQDTQSSTAAPAPAPVAMPAASSPYGPHALDPATMPAAALADTDAATAAKLAALDEAYATQVVYIVGKEQLRIGEGDAGAGWAARVGAAVGPRAWRRAVLALFVWVRENSGTRAREWKVPVEKLVEVGFVKTI